MADYTDKWLQLVVDTMEHKYGNKLLPNGSVYPYGFLPFGSSSTGNKPARDAIYMQYYNNLGNIKSQLSRGLTDAERAQYSAHASDAVSSNNMVRAFIPQWDTEFKAADDKKAQDAQLAAQQAALQKQQQDAEKQKQEQAAALAAQQAALEKQRKETEFKTALDAMNQRSSLNPQRAEEVGAINATEDEQKKKKNKRIGYDATKITGLLGTPNTERKQLLGI